MLSFFDGAAGKRLTEAVYQLYWSDERLKVPVGRELISIVSGQLVAFIQKFVVLKEVVCDLPEPFAKCGAGCPHDVQAGDSESIAATVALIRGSRGREKHRVSVHDRATARNKANM